MTFTRQVARHARDDRPEHCEQCTRPIKKGQGWVLVQALGVGNGRSRRPVAKWARHLTCPVMREEQCTRCRGDGFIVWEGKAEWCPRCHGLGLILTARQQALWRRFRGERTYTR